LGKGEDSEVDAATGLHHLLHDLQLRVVIRRKEDSDGYVGDHAVFGNGIVAFVVLAEMPALDLPEFPCIDAGDALVVDHDDVIQIGMGAGGGKIS